MRKKTSFKHICTLEIFDYVSAICQYHNNGKKTSLFLFLLKDNWNYQSCFYRLFFLILILVCLFFTELYFPWKMISGSFLRPKIEVNSSKEDLLWLLPGGITLNYIHYLGFFFFNHQ